MDIKEILLKKITENKFFDICNFVEELYLMDCDLLILMARKFFNLFCVFHEINCQKYERLEIPYQQEKKIITNRALPLLRHELQNHRFQKIVIADDIIIHGRSIREVYDEVAGLCPEAETLLISYIRNDQETSTYEDIMGKMRSRYLGETYDEWRELSDEIVNIFYMSGRPYISYLPYFTLDIEWERLMDKLRHGECLPIQNEDMKKYRVEAWMYTGRELDIFQNLKICSISTIRFYYYQELDKVIAVPYFCLDVVEGKLLEKISDFVRKKYFTQEYQKLAEQNSGADEMRAMELEYTLSAWMCMYAFDLLGIQTDTWHKEIERYNFCETLLPAQMLSDQKIPERLEEIEKIGGQICPENLESNSDIQILLKKYRELKEVYKKHLPRLRKMSAWTGGPTDYVQRFIDNYLVVNGGIDEERCKNNHIEKKRLFGIPLSGLLNDMSEFLWSLNGEEVSRSRCLNQSFAAVLKAVDSGKGSIVTKEAGRDAPGWFSESVIYAGEQNYKFYENTNFPIMYGLYLIEQESGRQNAFEKIKDRKEQMVDNFAQYLEGENIFYIKEEMQQIADSDISSNYKKFLQNSYEKYYGNQVLAQAVQMALNICGSVQE